MLAESSCERSPPTAHGLEEPHRGEAQAGDNLLSGELSPVLFKGEIQNRAWNELWMTGCSSAGVTVAAAFSWCSLTAAFGLKASWHA